MPQRGSGVMAKFVAVLGSSSLHSAHNSNTSVEHPCTSWAKNNAREAWHKFCLLPDDHQLGDRVRLQVSHGVARRELRAVIWVWTTTFTPWNPNVAQNSLRIYVVLFNRIQQLLGCFTVIGKLLELQVLNYIGKGGVPAL